MARRKFTAEQVARITRDALEWAPKQAKPKHVHVSVKSCLDHGIQIMISIKGKIMAGGLEPKPIIPQDKLWAAMDQAETEILQNDADQIMGKILAKMGQELLETLAEPPTDASPVRHEPMPN